MKKFVKHYIGKGKEVKNAKLATPLVEVNLSLEEIEKHTFEKDGKKWLNFTIGSRLKEDAYGKTHNVWVTTLEEVEDEKPAPAKKPTPKKRTPAKK
jgi:hypothetical protein